ncbi:MAG TPA: AMP-binding protein, partial [Polyangia bacterium]|nr:AMP-binding protein [Polyangia bacterium]
MNARTLPELVREAAERFGARAAIVDPENERSLTFSGLAAAVEEAARAWMALGVERGDRVALWAPNSWAWEVAALGAQSAGAVLVPLNTRWKAREAAYVLERSRARALVTVVGFLDVDYVARLRES